VFSVIVPVGTAIGDTGISVGPGIATDVQDARMRARKAIRLVVFKFLFSNDLDQHPLVALAVEFAISAQAGFDLCGDVPDVQVALENIPENAW
jgi:hypothetical protein